MEAQRRVTDPTALRALAHPSRLAMLDHLTLEGPLTATELADRLDESPANCSWHLRTLAKHGFVVEAPGSAGRRRPWQVVSDGWSIPDSDEPGGVEAASAVTDLLLDRALGRYRRSRQRRSPDDLALTAFAVDAMWVTPDEARTLHREIQALLQPYTERCRQASSRPADARLVETVMWSACLGDEAQRHEH